MPVDRVAAGLFRREVPVRVPTTRREVPEAALRRTLLAVLLTDDAQWIHGASLDSRRRVVLDTDAEDRLTAWMIEHLLLGWVPCTSKDETDALEAEWIEKHQPALNTDGTEHGQRLTELKRGFIGAITRSS